METSKEPVKFDEWALIELFGHQRIAGKVSETTLAGGAFIRVDVPETKGQKAYTRFFNPSAVYSISPSTEELVMRCLESWQNVPVQRYELPEIPQHIGNTYEPSHENEEPNED